MISKTIPKDFIDVRNSPVDIHDIEMNIRNFYLSLTFDKKDSIKTQCLDARAYLNNSINLTKSLIMPEENIYIKKYMKAYFWMIDNLGRASKKINDIENDNLRVLNAFENDAKSESIESPILRMYMNSLNTQMDNLVIFPLMKAYNKFKDYPEEDEEDNKIIKDSDLFNYLLFVELKNSSELIGSLAEEKVQFTTTPSKSKSQSNYESRGQRTFNPNEDNPPSKPEEIKVEQDEREPEEIKQMAEDFFSDDIINSKDKNKSENILFEDDDMEIIEEEDEDESD